MMLLLSFFFSLFTLLLLPVNPPARRRVTQNPFNDTQLFALRCQITLKARLRRTHDAWAHPAGA